MGKIKKFFLAILAIILIVEEWLWDMLTALGAYISQTLHLQKFERWLAKSSPTVAITIFIIPILIVAPINLFGFMLIAHGHLLHGLVVECFAKLLGTLMIARVFKITRKQLLTFRWLEYVYLKILGWLRWARELIISTATYRMVKQLKEQISRYIRNTP